MTSQMEQAWRDLHHLVSVYEQLNDNFISLVRNVKRDSKKER